MAADAKNYSAMTARMVARQLPLRVVGVVFFLWGLVPASVAAAFARSLAVRYLAAAVQKSLLCGRRILVLLIGIVGTLAMLLTAPVSASNNWTLVHAGPEVRVAQRHYKGSALDEVRGVVRVNTTLNALMALLKDADFNRQWVYRSGGARVLKEEGYAQAYVHGIVDAPFPMIDRDTVVRFDYRQDPITKEIVVTIKNFPHFIPPMADFVRVPEFGGFWKLTPESGGWVKVTYQVYGDPGGWVPVWLANQAALVSVQNTLLNLKSVVDRYSGAQSDFVQEPAGAVSIP